MPRFLLALVFAAFCRAQNTPALERVLTFEAGLTGVPIVTYDYDFHAEIIVDGETGYLAPLRDVPALAERVCVALDDPPQAHAVGQRLRQRLLREHSLEAVMPLYRQAYDLVLRAA